MESISITDLTDHQWKQYFDVTQELTRKYYPEFYDESRVLNTVKHELIKYHQSNIQFNHKYWLIFDETLPVAWYSYTNYPPILGWNFDVCADEIPENIMNYILRGISDRLKELDDTYTAHNWEYDMRKIKILKNVGALGIDKFLLTRLYRKDMNKELFESYIEKHKPSAEFKVLYLNKFPEEILSKLAPFFNLLNKDISKLSPNPVDFPEQTEEDIRRYISINTDEISKNHILLIMDGDNEIAGICSVLEDRIKIPRLRHHGGFTGVTEKYRGRGFAKFMKAYMYLKLLNENVPFEYAYTDTMPWNKYMFRINEALGFKPHKEGFEFKLTKEQLKNYLESTN